MESISEHRRRAKKVALTQRDTALMEELVLRRAEEIRELHDLFFWGLSRKRVVNRLAELVGAGYLHKVRCVPFGQSEPVSVYTLGPKARVALELRSLSSEHFRFRRWNPTLRDSSIPHQLAVNRVVDLLKTRAVPEHLLPVTERGGARHRPDALLAAQSRWAFEARPFVALEIDLGHYSRERIIGKVRGFQALDQANHLLIVVPDEARREKVRGWAHEGYEGRDPASFITVRTMDEVYSFSNRDLWDYEGEEPFLRLELVAFSTDEFGLASYGAMGV